MSVLIKDMEMPKHISAIVFINPDGTVHYETKGETGFHYTSAVEVPDGHGRLIDADALINLVNRCIFPSDMATTLAVSMVVNWVKEAPTVIPSDKDGET